MKAPHSAPSPSGDLGIPEDYGTRRGLTLQDEATELVSVGVNSEGRDIRLTPGAADAWEQMKAAAAAEGIALEAFSGFRSIERQAEIIRRKRAAGETIEAILSVVAAPGYSEHHTGRAVDIGVPQEIALTEAFATTPAHAWLIRNAANHGFTLSFPPGNPHGIAYEPWHWLFGR